MESYDMLVPLVHIKETTSILFTIKDLYASLTRVIESQTKISRLGYVRDHDPIKGFGWESDKKIVFT